jgi:hypothetical protein
MHFKITVFRYELHIKLPIFPEHLKDSIFKAHQLPSQNVFFPALDSRTHFPQRIRVSGKIIPEIMHPP